jgi:mRNA-degrading endonuclease YafQ of YafQ-DinJ toxin-antitoxin module
VDTKKRYQIKLHNCVISEDLLNLPYELKQDLVQYQKVLSLDPLQTKGIPSHDLKGDLRGYRALEIDWNNISYRLVYRISEKPAPKQVLILSFGEHDFAYEKAKERKS